MFDLKKNKLVKDFLKKSLVLAVFFSLSFLPAFPVSLVVEAAESNASERIEIWRENEIKVDRKKSFETIVSNAANYTDLILEFSYDSTELDGIVGETPADFFEYGWTYTDREGVSAASTFFIEGKKGSDPEEIGTVALPLPENANVDNLAFFMRVVANSDGDRVVITDLTLTGLNPDYNQGAEGEEGDKKDGEEDSSSNNKTPESETSPEDKDNSKEGNDAGESTTPEESKEEEVAEIDPRADILWEETSVILNINKPLQISISTENYTDLKWYFTYDSTELEEKNSANASVPSDYFVYGYNYFDEEGNLVSESKKILGKTGATDEEKGTIVLSLPENANVEDLNLFIEVVADSATSDKVRISNLALVGIPLELAGDDEDKKNDEDGEKVEEDKTKDGTTEGDDNNNDQKTEEKTEPENNGENAESDDVKNDDQEDKVDAGEVADKNETDPDPEDKNNDEDTNQTENDEDENPLWEVEKITLRIDRDKKIEANIDTSVYEKIVWKFDYDSRKLDSGGEDYFEYGWFYKNDEGVLVEGKEKIDGLAGEKEEEVGEVKLEVFSEEVDFAKDLTLFIEIFANSSSSDDVKISNLTVEGFLAETNPEDNNEDKEKTEPEDSENGEGNEEPEDSVGDKGESAEETPEESGDKNNIDEEDYNGEEDGNETNPEDKNNDDEDSDKTDPETGESEKDKGEENSEKEDSDDESTPDEDKKEGAENDNNENPDQEENDENNDPENTEEDNNDGDINDEEETSGEEDTEVKEGDSDDEDGKNTEDNNSDEEIEAEKPTIKRDVMSYRLTRDVTSYRTTYEERVANRY